MADLFKPEYIEQARKLAALGATDREVAEFFEVSESTVRRWRHAHPEFGRALKLGKDAADERVEQSLYRRATGYTHDAVRIFQYQGQPVKVPYEEHHAPLPTDPNDIPALAALWKRVYNTPLGAGTEAEFIDDYQRYVTAPAAA